MVGGPRRPPTPSGSFLQIRPCCGRLREATVVRLATLVAATEGAVSHRVGIAPREHVARVLERAAARVAVQGGFEAAAIGLFLVRGIAGLVDVAETDPPLLA